MKAKTKQFIEKIKVLNGEDKYQKSKRGFSVCFYKTEGKLKEWLHHQLPSKFINTQKTFDDLISPKGRHYKFDFMVDDIVIELDGGQHFIDVSNWTPCEITLNNDIIKTKYLLKNDYTLIRIYQPWVYDDSNKWDEQLRRMINRCMEHKKVGVHYIGDEIYDKHKAALTLALQD